jgi:hypothetical protein
MPHALRVAALAAVLAVGFAATARAEMRCEMTFELDGWSAFYKSASGTGHVTCSNGQAARVMLRVDGGGFTFGSSGLEGKGTFSGVLGIEDVMGGYFRMAAEGGPSGAWIYTKGPVRLAVAGGKGHGFTVGFDFGRLRISRA